MERIEALISKLKEQFEEQADPNLMLGTVQLLQFELTKLKSGNQQILGTAKVAVMLPATSIMGAVAAQHEKYAPRPADQPLQAVKEVVKEEKKIVEEIKETVLVDNGTLSVVQKNGQLDMVFDPMTEIPTLSHQPKEKEVNDATKLGESLNDKLKQGKTELVEILKEAPVKDLRKAVGINDRFLFINELFRGDESMYERSIKTINSFNIYAEAEYWISRELKVKLGWNHEQPSVKHFDQLVKRRFS
ncbi:MAG: hypothetical protein SGI83_19005 [Bacteroidota bacterium]|nr:hypothetical protein [Bacteroidota bacterium]